MQQLILIFIVYYFVLNRDYEIEFLKKNFFAAPIFQSMVLYPISIYLMLIHYYEFGYQGQMNWFLYICLMALSICLLFLLFDLIRNWIKVRYTDMYYNNHFFISLPLSLRTITTLIPYDKFKPSRQLYYAVMNILIMSIVVLMIGLIEGFDFLKVWFNIH
jgi:CDP-diglyceride synthetase